MDHHFASKPKLGISACLLGQTVRYDGGHKRDNFLTDTLGRFVEWVPVCPELEVGMGVPREPVRLLGKADDPSMIAERSGKDWTAAMKRFGTARAGELKRLNLSGYVFKKDSPSCGMARVKIYSPRGGATRMGSGLFARVVKDALPLMPAEEEGRLKDPVLRENFIERVFAYQRAGKRPRPDRSPSERWSRSTRRTNFSCWPIASCTIVLLDAWSPEGKRHRWVKFTNATAAHLWKLSASPPMPRDTPTRSST